MSNPWKKDWKVNQNYKKLLKSRQKLLKHLNWNKNKNNIFIISVALIVFIGIILSTSLQWNFPVDAATSTDAPNITLAKTNDSVVVKEGPYGNISSNVTIAYIVGVHPRESASHQAIVESIRQSDGSLNKAYYLYIIKAPIYEENYPAERMNGQLMANRYVVPDIINNSYQLAVDVHSSNGSYAAERFVFVPIYENKSITIAQDLDNSISWLTYYYPSIVSSPEYVTIPLIESGIPSIVYETYKYDSNTTTREHAQEFIRVIDRSKIF